MLGLAIARGTICCFRDFFAAHCAKERIHNIKIRNIIAPITLSRLSIAVTKP